MAPPLLHLIWTLQFRGEVNLNWNCCWYRSYRSFAPPTNLKPQDVISRRYLRPMIKVRSYFRGGRSNATASCSKCPLWDPSQKGLLPDRPHRHKEIMVRPCNPYTLPFISTISKSPSTFVEPLLLMVIFVLLIFQIDWWQQATLDIPDLHPFSKTISNNCFMFRCALSQQLNRGLCKKAATIVAYDA